MINVELAVKGALELKWTTAELEKKAQQTLDSIKRDLDNAKASYPGLELANTKSVQSMLNVCIDFLQQLAKQQNWNVDHILKPYKSLLARVNKKIEALNEAKKPTTPKIGAK